MTTFNVGDKVRVSNLLHVIQGSSFFDEGDISTVTHVGSMGVYVAATKNKKANAIADRVVSSRNGALLFLPEEYSSLERVFEKDYRAELDATLAQIAELTEHAKDLAKLVAQEVASAPSRRAHAIRIAKEVVRDIENNLGFKKIQFYPNAKKGVVLARITSRSAFSDKQMEVSRGMAKLAPGDEYDENIGKAIAALRATGREVPTILTEGK